MRVEPVRGRRVLREQLHRPLPELCLAGITRSVFERGQRCPRPAQYVCRSSCGRLLNQRRMRRQGSVPNLCTWHPVQDRELHGRGLHLPVHVQYLGSVCVLGISRLQSVRVQREHLLRHLYQRHPMRFWKSLLKFLMRSQACWGELRSGNGLSIGFLCPGRVLRPCVYGCLHCLQRGRESRKLQQRRRQSPGSARQVCRNQFRNLWNNGKLRGRGLRVR